MYIQTENTPNPNSIKFLPGCTVINEPMYFNSYSDAVGKSLFAGKFFHVQGIEKVFFGQDFITITKEVNSDWNILKPEILMTIMDHFMAGLPVMDNNHEYQSKNYDHLPEIEKQIIEIIETRVRPSVAQDGGDIVYRGFENGIVKLELRGACSGCPSSSVTLKNGIESMLKHFVPEVLAVEAVDEL